MTVRNEHGLSGTSYYRARSWAANSFIVTKHFEEDGERCIKFKSYFKAEKTFIMLVLS